MTQLVGIFGYPLGHSISPDFQQAAFDHYCIDARYEAWPTHPDLLEPEVNKLRSDAYLGGNVTVPHKLQVMELLDEIDPLAKTIGAVNTIVRDGERLLGFNTDAYGFVKSLKEVGKFDPNGKKVLLLGAGGAARAAAFGLASEGISSLTIANRTLSRAESLTEDVRKYLSEAGQKTDVYAISMTDDALGNASAGADLIVNSTSIGMTGTDSLGASPLGAHPITETACVYDMVYNPPTTPLLSDAQKAGATAVNGLPMLIYQGAAAFEKWTGRPAPIEVMFAAGKRALNL